jgi:hypothetical protein
MNARESFNEALAEIAAQPDVFTGTYFTQDDEGYTLHIVVKEGQEPQIKLPASDQISVSWEYSPRSLSELHELRALVRDSGIVFTSIERVLATGRLLITMPTEEGAAEARQNWSDFADVEVGPMLTNVSCGSRLSCTPWRGGTEVRSPHEQCTWGFIGRGRNNGTLMMLTAGHCFADTWSHNYVTIGTTTKALEGVWYDSQKVPGGGATGQPFNQIYYNSSIKTYPITSVEDTPAQHIGDLVNYVGIASGLHAAEEVLDDDFEFQAVDGHGDTITYDGAKASAASPVIAGDSGGPVFFNGAADGMISAGGGAYTAYVFAILQEQGLNVDICTSGPC